MTNTRRIVVFGATGQQGAAVARHLVQHPAFTVRGITRNPASPAALALEKVGAEMLRGDLDDPASVRRVLEGAYGVFSVQNFMEAGVEGEIRQGKTVADAARGANVQHLIYSSVVSADRKTGLPHFESKWQIEQHIRQLGIPFTILRPAFFMQNWYQHLRDQILQGTLPLPLDPSRSLQQISVEDIGVIATLAFQSPGRWLNRTLELASQEYTMMQLADLFTRILGRSVAYSQVPWEQFRQAAGDEMTRMYRWFNDVGYHVDMAGLRREYANLSTLERVIRQQDWLGTSQLRKAA
jgi:uncharacterized protein YbjT (DUF2867 family)